MITKNSLAFKNAIVYFILFLIGIGLLGFLLLSYASLEIISASEKQLEHNSELITIKFQEHISELNQDINYLSKSPLLFDFIHNRNQSNLEKLNLEYLALLNSKPNYSQIRFIGIENNGKEIIRVERRPDSLNIIQGRFLQSKSDRDYFQATIKLPKDSLYLSPIDLNKEFGKISEPAIPTIRAAYPVYENNQIQGIIVVNMDLNPFFQSLQKTVVAPAVLRIINADNYYILHEKKENMFLFEYDKPSTVFQDFNEEIYQKITQKSGIVTWKNKLIFAKNVKLNGSTYNLKTLIISDREDILQNYFKWRNNSFLLIFGLGCLFMALAFFILNKQYRNLKEITTKLRAFPKTLLAANLPTNRKDEIGDLAKGFDEMSILVRENVQSLEEAKIIAEKAVKEKEEFLENISHEIRNPLQSISGLSEILIKNNNDPSLEGLLKNLKFNTSNLNILINDFLEFKNVLNGQIQLKKSWFSIHHFLDELHKSNQYFAITKKINFQWSIPEQLNDIEVCADKLRLSQILNNLITNAIKFTPEKGNVSLSIQQAKDDETLIFSVEDSGTGITKEEINIITQRYKTIDNHAPFTDSFGIGLTIVCELLEIMGSELHIESKKHAGTTFSFLLNLPKRFNDYNTQNNKNISQLLSNNISILIIEDDPQIIDLYKHMFEQQANLLSIIQDISELQKHSFNNYDIIICDYRVNHIKLPDFINQISRFLNDKTLFFVVSAQHIDLDSTDYLNQIHSFILKPFESDNFIEIINDAWARNHFGKPNFSSIVYDYDGNSEKFNNAIKILQSEWTRCKSSLTQAIQDKNKQSFDEITHKIITSIRRLELVEFENFLDRVNKEILDSSKTKILTQELHERMNYYLMEINRFLNPEKLNN